MLLVSETTRGSALVEIISRQFCVPELTNKVLLVTGDLGALWKNVSLRFAMPIPERCKAPFLRWVYHTASL